MFVAPFKVILLLRFVAKFNFDNCLIFLSYVNCDELLLTYYIVFF